MLIQISFLSGFLFHPQLIKITLFYLLFQILIFFSYNLSHYRSFLNIHHYLISFCIHRIQYLFTFILCINNFKFDFRHFPYSVVYFILEYFSNLVKLFRLFIDFFDLHNQLAPKQKSAKKTR